MKTNHRRGSALIICMVAVIITASMAAGYLITVEWQLRGSTMSFEGESAIQLADAGVTLSMDELLKDADVDGDGGVGTVNRTYGRGSIYVVTVDNGDGTFNVTSTGTVGSALRTVEGVVENTPGTPITGTGIAAVVAKGDIPLLGNIEVDGRDFSADLATDTPVDPVGVLGIFDEGVVTSGGSNTVGGAGQAPVHTDEGTLESNGIIDQNGDFANSSDEDGDGVSDEEAWDGIDNDGDGVVDEDVNSFPSGPDAYFRQPDGTLKASAQAAGSYFTTEADFTAWKAANVAAGELGIPGGSIVYLDFDTFGPAAELIQTGDVPAALLDAAEATLIANGLPTDANTVALQAVLDQPGSILIHHNATSTAQMKNMHGFFKGAVLGDQMDHFNAGTEVRGTIVSFGNQVGGNAFGNGTAQLRFSSAALNDLPSVGNPTVFLRSWRQVVTTSTPPPVP